MKRLSFIIVAACLLAGCGSAHQAVHLSVATTKVANQTQCNPALGKGHLGVCTTQPANAGLRVPPGTPTVVAGRKFIPDASEFQGAVNWGAAHAQGLYAGIVKAYEVNFRQDSQFSRSWHQLTALHLWHAAYLFVRGGPCNAVADTYVGIVRANGGWDFMAGPPILDVEVPSAVGMVPCLVARIQHDTGISSVIVYTAPGTWPGGGNANAPLWIATYGTHFGCIWTCHPVAWQFTDGIFGPTPHSVYGLARGDISLDFGISGMFAHLHPPANPICFNRRIPRTQCTAVKKQIAGWQRGADVSQKVYAHRKCPALAQRARWFANRIATDHSARGKQQLVYRKGALASTRQAQHNRSCGLFGQRVAHFNNLIKQAEEKN